MQRTLSSLAACSLILAGCASAPLPGAALDEVRIETRGADAGGEACADFSLTSAQARYFLSRSVVVTAAQQREGWDVLPCYVRGTARSANVRVFIHAKLGQVRAHGVDRNQCQHQPERTVPAGWNKSPECRGQPTAPRLTAASGT